MYVPKPYQMNDMEITLDFIRRNSFGLLITHSARSAATPLPFLVKQEGDSIRLYGHLARANPQSQELDGEALVVFSGPHAYISPTWYGDAIPEVPTWNYQSAHVYGRCSILADPEEVLKLLEDTIDYYESSQQKPWSLTNVDPAYVQRLAKHIVGFSIEATQIEGAWKLHQDYPLEARRGAIAALGQRSDDNSRLIAKLMQERLDETNDG
ncbi:FMN-binding negative transcriptional regulator [Paenibacillus hodogayensis]|uniref:FMN-binding negative transcriptional regulator n=1 Tax=Paenibacillus hodogayensis TaxID=279208 RepID=A0ABV5W4B7_9BACL